MIRQEEVTVNVTYADSATLISEPDKSRIISTYSQHGLVLVELAETDFQAAEQNLVALQVLFGSFLDHKHSRQGIVPITCRPGVYTDGVRRPQSSRERQSPHSDGGYGIPPAVVVLATATPAWQGGQGLVIDMKDAYNFMSKRSPDQLRLLFRGDAYTVVRGNQTASRPVFIEHADGISACYAKHEFNEILVSLECETAFNLLTGWIMDHANQTIIQPRSGQIALYDNSRVLHGRTAWEDQQSRERLVLRAWYNGVSPALTGYLPGFSLLEKESEVQA